MNISAILFGVFLILFGVLMIILRLKRAPIIVNNYKTQNLEKRIGRKGADIYTIFVWAMLIILGVYVIYTLK